MEVKLEVTQRSGKKEEIVGWKRGRLPNEVGKKKKSLGGKEEGYPTKWEKRRNRWVVKRKAIQRNGKKEEIGGW